MRCFLVAPDRARLSRLCRWWPRSCSGCVRAGSSVFAFLHEIAASLARSTRLYRVIVTEILELTPIPPHGASGGQSVTIYLYLVAESPECYATYPPRCVSTRQDEIYLLRDYSFVCRPAIGVPETAGISQSGATLF